MKRLLLGTCICANAACGSGDAHEGGNARVPVWQLIEEYRIGSIDGEGPERFGDFVALGEDSAGTLFVADNQSAELRPAFESVSADDHGRVWVGSPRPAGRHGFEVFDEEGGLLAQASLPPDIRPTSAPLVQGDRMYVITRGELDFPYVISLRIRSAPHPDS